LNQFKLILEMNKELKIDFALWGPTESEAHGLAKMGVRPDLVARLAQ
jgi:hypothetical protein